MVSDTKIMAGIRWNNRAIREESNKGKARTDNSDLAKNNTNYNLIGQFINATFVLRSISKK